MKHTWRQIKLLLPVSLVGHLPYLVFLLLGSFCVLDVAREHEGVVVVLDVFLQAAAEFDAVSTTQIILARERRQPLLFELLNMLHYRFVIDQHGSTVFVSTLNKYVLVATTLIRAWLLSTLSQSLGWMRRFQR